MITTLHENGKPLGLDYDYEYRGAKRERSRDAAQIKPTIIWFSFVAIFAFLGILILVKHFSSSAQTEFARTLLVSLLCFAIAALFVGIWKHGRSTHQRLLDFIERRETGKI